MNTTSLLASFLCSTRLLTDETEKNYVQRTRLLIPFIDLVRINKIINNFFMFLIKLHCFRSDYECDTKLKTKNLNLPQTSGTLLMKFQCISFRKTTLKKKSVPNLWSISQKVSGVTIPHLYSKRKYGNSNIPYSITRYNSIVRGPNTSTWGMDYRTA